MSPSNPRCTWPGCLHEATHGLEYTARTQRWHARDWRKVWQRGKCTLPRSRTETRFCRWHATCAAHFRNAGEAVPGEATHTH